MHVKHIRIMRGCTFEPFQWRIKRREEKIVIKWCKMMFFFVSLGVSLKMKWFMIELHFRSTIGTRNHWDSKELSFESKSSQYVMKRKNRKCVALPQPSDCLFTTAHIPSWSSGNTRSEDSWTFFSHHYFLTSRHAWIHVVCVWIVVHLPIEFFRYFNLWIFQILSRP